MSKEKLGAPDDISTWCSISTFVEMKIMNPLFDASSVLASEDLAIFTGNTDHRKLSENVLRFSVRVMTTSWTLSKLT